MAKKDHSDLSWTGWRQLVLSEISASEQFKSETQSSTLSCLLGRERSSQEVSLCVQKMICRMRGFWLERVQIWLSLSAYHRASCGLTVVSTKSTRTDQDGGKLVISWKKKKLRLDSLFLSVFFCIIYINFFFFFFVLSYKYIINRECRWFFFRYIYIYIFKLYRILSM